MHDVTVVYWRDIPAQIIIGKGRRGIKKQLSERFEKAIDMCAMRIGAKDADTYLAEWRKISQPPQEGIEKEIILAEVAKFENIYNDAHLKNLIKNDGWEDKNSKDKNK